jgi:hypothetical protein
MSDILTDETCDVCGADWRKTVCMTCRRCTARLRAMGKGKAKSTTKRIQKALQLEEALRKHKGLA